MIRIRDINEKTLEFIKMALVTTTALTVLINILLAASYATAYNALATFSDALKMSKNSSPWSKTIQTALKQNIFVAGFTLGAFRKYFY